MKSLAPILILTVLFASLIHADTAGYAQCAKKNPDAANAIRALCSRTDIVTGTTHQQDVFAFSGKATARIMPHHQSAGCDPPEWVPSRWCAAQFYDLCARSGGGWGHRAYGSKGCQLFNIYRTGDESQGLNTDGS